MEKVHLKILMAMIETSDTIKYKDIYSQSH